jgi:hypothetical protein
VSAVLDWQDPPREVLDARDSRGGRRRESKLAGLAEELRLKPAEWALVYDGPSTGAASGMATHIRLGQLQAFTPTGDFDAVSCKGRAWARYVGGDE